jgi:hypothetical protein
MELFQVRYFLALSKTLNFTRAAEACNVMQPALASDSPFSSQCRVGNVKIVPGLWNENLFRVLEGCSPISPTTTRSTPAAAPWKCSIRQ